MRKALVVALLLGSPAALAAQPCGPGGRLAAGMAPGRVSITLRAGERLKATLLCIDRDRVILSDGTHIRTVELDDVERIVKPRDRLWNGLAIGAAIGLWVGGSTYGEAKYGGARRGPYVSSAVATFGALGIAIDAMNGASWTVYARPPGPETRSTR